MKRLTRLGPNHKAACRMKVEGQPIRVIADTLGVKAETLYEWFSDDMIKAEIARLSERIDEVFAEKMAEMAMVGVGGLTAMAHLPIDAPNGLSPHTMLDVLKEILDRNAATAKVGAAQQGGGVNVFNLNGTSTEELVARGRQLLMRAGSVDGSAADAPAK